MSFKELDCLSDSLFDYEDELDEYEGKLTSLMAATPQGFAARQEDIDSLMTVLGWWSTLSSTCRKPWIKQGATPKPPVTGAIFSTLPVSSHTLITNSG